MIVDAHAHIFPAVRGRIGRGPVRGVGYGRVRIGDDPPIQLFPPFHEQTAFTAEMLIAHMDWAGVDRAVLLQGPFYGECNAYAADAIRRHPSRLSGCAYVDPWRPDARRAFDATFDQVGDVMCGVKIEFSEATGLFGLYPGARLDEPALDWLWHVLETRQNILVLDLGAVGSGSYQTRAVREIAHSRPGLRIVVAHLGQPAQAVDRDPPTRDQWLEQLELGQLHNVWFDCSALPAYAAAAGETYPFPSATRHLAEAISRIGAEKIMYGSDAPGLLGHASYPQLLNGVRSALGSLTAPARAGVLGECAAGVFPPRPRVAAP